MVVLVVVLRCSHATATRQKMHDYTKGMLIVRVKRSWRGTVGWGWRSS